MTYATREYERSFHAMGTEVRVIVAARDPEDTNELLRRVEMLFEKCEQRFSRFMPDSELSRLNRGGYLDYPSPEIVGVLKRSVEWEKSTSGVFNPMVLTTLEAAGYDRSFELIDGSNPQRLCRSSAVDSLAGHLRFGRDAKRESIRLNGVNGLDLGGIVKGWAVDSASGLLSSHSAYLIDAGGDIRTRSTGGHPGWHVSIEDPLSPDHDREIVNVSNRAIATSGVYGRRWSDGASEYHHLIDPRTGCPSTSDIIAASVIAPSTEAAEVLAKTCVIAGSQAAISLLNERPECCGVLTCRDGLRITSDSWDSQVAFGPLRFQPMGRVA